MARVKCNRCDRYYSGMHLKCPYCGAHRSKKTVRKEQEEMSNSKFVVGGIILIALIVAVVILIIASLNGNNKPAADDNTPQGNDEYVQDEGVDSITGTEGADTDTEADTDTDTDIDTNTNTDESSPEDSQTPVEINSVSIVRNGTVQTDVTFFIGDTYEYSFETDPATTDEVAIWSSDDESVASVLQNGQVTAVGTGSTFINVTVGGKTGSMIVRVRG